MTSIQSRRFEPSVETMPPPAKRVKSVEEWRQSEMGTSASPEAETQVASIMRKRFHSSSPIDEKGQGSVKKSKKEEAIHSPTTSSMTPKLDDNVFASAYALASLALSPGHAYASAAPYSPNPYEQTREDDDGRIDEPHYSLREPSSPGIDGILFSPSGSTADIRRRRVKFAKRMEHMRRVPYGRMGVPNRMLFRHGPAFHPPPRQPYPYGATPWSVPMGPPPIHGPGAPTIPTEEREWICDYCHVASFATFDEACAHESTCHIRGTEPTERKMHDGRGDHSLALYDHHRFDDHKEPPEDNAEYFTGSVALAVPSADADWLSELNCFIRQNCVEAFSASEEEIARSNKRGRIVLGQVGIRCQFCAHCTFKAKAIAAVSYPTSVSGIYESVKRWQRVHQAVCRDIPRGVREKLESLQETSVWIPTTRQYWAESARALGMTDTYKGIRFDRPPSIPKDWVPNNHSESSAADDTDDAGAEAGYIALPCDRDEIPEYVYFLMRQVQFCRFTEADRFVARSKGPVGFAGFQCRHCSGHAGLGKYFPLTLKSLATNSTSQNIHAHLLKCRKASPQLKETLLRLKNEKSNSPRLVPGWRRRFFGRIWERLHGEEAAKA